MYINARHVHDLTKSLQLFLDILWAENQVLYNNDLRCYDKLSYILGSTITWWLKVLVLDIMTLAPEQNGHPLATAYSNTFSWMKFVEFWFKVHLSL